MSRPLSPAFEAFIAPARGSCALWQTAAGLIVTFVAGIALYQLLLALVATWLGPDRMVAVMDEVTFYGDTPRAVLIALFTYIVFASGLAMALRALHERDLWSVFGPSPVALRDFVRVFGAVTVLFLVLILVLPRDYAFERQVDLPMRAWIGFLPLALVAILVQAGTEEAVFRGYLQQQLAARLPEPAIWIGVPALLFGLLHYSSDAGPNAWWFVLWAMAFGCAAADLTARTGALGAALGLHMANNAVAILGVSLAGPGSGLALFVLPLEADAPDVTAILPAEFATLLVAWLAARVALRL